MDVEAFEPNEWIAEGDTVVSLGEFGCRVRATDKRSRTRWVFIWKFRDAKVFLYEQFMILHWRSPSGKLVGLPTSLDTP